VPFGSNGRSKPVKLDRLRFTSPRRVLIEQIQAQYGGKVEPWQPPRGNSQWQVITNTTEVPVLIPPQDPSDSQWYEMWSAGGCQRRCDGQMERLTQSACLCEPTARDCKIHTRLRVMLEEIPGLGAWRVDTGSYYAAVELPGIAQLLAMAQGAIPGRLVLDQRTVTRQVDGQPQTFNFVVPTLHVDEITPAQLVSGRVQELISARRAAAIENGELRQLTAKVDYPSLIGAALNREALLELFAKAEKDGVAEELKPLFEQRAAAIDTSAAQREPAAVVVDAQVVETTSDVDQIWSDILAMSPWDTADELERNFCAAVGRSSDEATADDMRQFLATLTQTAGAAA
jgi:hypothetical protein